MGTPVVVVHDTKWYKDNLVSKVDIYGAIPERNFGIRTLMGDMITHNSDRQHKYSRLDYFLFMLSSEEIKLILRLMNYQSEKHLISTKSIGEILKFFIHDFSNNGWIWFLA